MTSIASSDLSLDLNDPDMKKHGYMHRPELYYRHGLTKAQRERIHREARERNGQSQRLSGR